VRNAPALLALALIAVAPTTSVRAQSSIVSHFSLRPRLSPRVEIEAARKWGPLATPAPPASGRKLRVLAVLDSPADAERLRAAGLAPQSALGNIVSLAVDADGLDRLAALRGVRAVRAPQVFRANLDVNGVENGAIAARSTGASGRGVLLAFIDSGIDFRHDDFRKADGRTRIKFLWDQLDSSYSDSGGTIGMAPPVLDEGGKPLGTVYTEDQINGALEETATVSSVDLAGHGTMAASAAAGNGRATGNGQPAGIYVGTAPEASLIAVRIGGAAKRDFSFPGDVLASLVWIGARAADLDMPVVVNMSFGGHIGPHDGTIPEELAIDSFLELPGRAVVVSAGNEGDENIHAKGSTIGSHNVQLFQAGEDSSIIVDCWIPGEDRVDFGFTDPSGVGVADLNIHDDNCATTTRAPNEVTACVASPDPVNGDRELLIFVDPSTRFAPISSGLWKFNLRDEGGVHSGQFDCWSALGQEFVADVDGGDRVAHPGTSRGAITVGAYAARTHWPARSGEGSVTAELGNLAPFSSPGPTRDGRRKPELVTGGLSVVGAWSIADGTGSGLAGIPPRPDLVNPDGVHLASAGTSFSAPQVSGAIALMFERNPNLTAATIKDVLRQTARADAFTGSVPNDAWGYGKLDVAAALEAVPGPSPTPTPIVSFPGDANCDAEIDDDDRAATVIALFSTGGRCSADCNRDGRVDVSDVLCVVQAFVAP